MLRTERLQFPPGNQLKSRRPAEQSAFVFLNAIVIRRTLKGNTNG